MSELWEKAEIGEESEAPSRGSSGRWALSLCGCMYWWALEGVSAIADPGFGPSMRMTVADGEAVSLALKYGRPGNKRESWVEVRGSEIPGAGDGVFALRTIWKGALITRCDRVEGACAASA